MDHPLAGSVSHRCRACSRASSSRSYSSAATSHLTAANVGGLVILALATGEGTCGLDEVGRREVPSESATCAVPDSYAPRRAEVQLVV